MANKYSRYQLQAPTSQYVDPQSVGVNQILRERYDQNKQGKDLIDRSLAQTQVMKGDQALLENAKTKVKNILGDVTEKGDYENSGLAIQDAANYVDQDPGVLAAKKSYENRSAELDFIRQATMEGKQILDFGKGAAQNHLSYFFNKDAESFQTSIYEPASESRLDYDAEMSGLLKTIKADSNGKGWEGITVGKADRVAAMMYENYIQSDAGKQDFRRLTELELPDNLSGEQKMVMAKKDIMHRLKGFTRQYVYDKITAPKVEEGKSNLRSNGLPKDIFTTSPKTIKGLVQDDVQAQSLHNLAILKDENLSDEDKMSKIKFNQGALDRSVKKFLEGQGESGQAKLARWEKITKAHNEEGDDRFFELTKSMTAYTNSPDTDYGEVFAGAFDEGIKMAGVGAIAGGGVGAAGFSAGPLGVLTTGGGVALGATVFGTLGLLDGGFRSFYDQLNNFNNVRDTGRGSDTNNDGKPGFFEGLWGEFVDSEEEELMEQLFGGNDMDGKDVSKINELLGTNYTEKDVPRLKDLAMSTYSFMVGKDGGITGDQIMEHVKNNGTAISSPGYYIDEGTTDGKKIQASIDTSFRKASPEQDFIIHGATTKSERDEFLGTDDNPREYWNNLKVMGVYEANATTDSKIKFLVKNGAGVEKFIELKEGSSLPGQTETGILNMVGEKMAVPGLIRNEKVRQSLNNTKRQNGNVTIGDYFDAESIAATNEKGGTREDAFEYRRLLEDQGLLRIILENPQYTREFLKDENDMLYLQSDGQNLPWFVNGGINEAVWALYQKQNPAIVSTLRRKMRERDISEMAY